MRTHGIISLVLTCMLCLPSLVGGALLVVNSLLYRRIEEWGQATSAFVALAVFISGPLVLLATVVGLLAVLNRTVPLRIKYAHLVIVLASAISTVTILFRFSM